MTQATKSFFEAYRDEPKVYSMQFMEGHEGTGQVINYIDEPIATLLNDLEQRKMLEDTVVVLISDHGLHMSSLLKLFQVANERIEITLPGLLISLP